MRKRLGLGAFGLLGLCGAWWILSLCVPQGFVPDPVSVLTRFVHLLPTVLWVHSLASLGRVGVALFAALLTAAPAGIALGRLRFLDWLFSPVAYVLYPVPKIALLPVVMVLLGLGNLSKATIVFLVLFFQVLVSCRDGAREIPMQYFLSLRSLGATRWQTLLYVIRPALLPGLLSSLRIGTGTALAVLFFAETFGTSRGLGWFVMDSWMRMAYVDMFAGIMCLGFVGLGLFLAIDLAERRLCRWQRKA
ncbi:MAG TPA: ABC transporter permease [Spirochaetia bacterium]|nr:ABC transporter permease [Spirochaetia bacterium]